MKWSLTIMLFLLTGSVSKAQTELSVDAEPFLSYTGNLIGGASVAPTWQGTQGLPLGFDLSQYREGKADWLRVRIFLHYSLYRDRVTVAQLDEDLQVIEGAFDEDIQRNSTLSASFSIEKEVRKGSGKLKGLWGRGLGASTSRVHRDRVISNSLSAYEGDTLLFDSRYGFGAVAYLYTGVLYRPTPQLSFSARINFGFNADYQPNGTARVVIREGSSVELESFPVQEEHSEWSLDVFTRPRFVLSFYF